jgi:hypothetical protein
MSCSRTWATAALLTTCLVSPPAARAGSYSAPTYAVSGGTTGAGIVLTVGGSSSVDAYKPSGGSCGASHVYTGSSAATLTASGTITASFVWQPDYSGETPNSVIVTETGSAGAGTSTAAGSSCDCGDGLGDSASGSATGKTSSGTHIRGVSGASPLTLSGVTPKATATTPGGYCSASVSYTATATAVTINPVGAVKDSNGNSDILIGQQCSPTLTGIPSNCTVSNYQWGVTGSTFQSWSASSTSTSFTDGPGALNVAGPSWCWYDSGNSTHVLEGITCTATVTPPAGQGAAFTVTASQVVNVYVPSWKATATAGTMRVDTSSPGGNGSDYWLYAGGPGMKWTASVSSPLVGVFGDGTIELVQTVTPGISYTTADGMVHNYSNNGQNGLDTSYPYLWATGAPNYTTNDNPGLNLTGTVAGSVKDQFQDYLMYAPPGSSQFVPLASSSWAANGSVNIPPTGWANFLGSAGTVTGGSFSASNTFPSWTQNVGNGHF